MDFIKDIKFDKNGLIPAIIQDINTNEVLMLAYMNEESLERTWKSGETWFYSRSRKKLWHKGEESGNTQEIIKMDYDCDGDTILVKVRQKGVACHTGEYSCFHNNILDKDIDGKIKDFIYRLYKLIEHRRSNPTEGSYTNYLFDQGIDKILKKVGEESSEVIIGAKNESRDEVVYEVSDLVYHILVLLVHMGIDIDDIKGELYKRHNTVRS
ncbi:bifunctional phosphoribosyl-AMP cyclohydrolase/phosphoribosyl-ATP diphosphatase HisIE [Clostridiisalibacter paucivorans]|uniref:bifunctional phosphoribosyl-AMP cyclohydrolase/phosphoribosyl-ATP diphosphatase HisIE n=1 Tax=Clostridiisalibacter paucivorans TaxID=408753 RepID=UPI00047A9E62|nr:bifunctional phosphoribosyl-AMP cyclohydrolase/phosphoribosyl-ATP diphosphatase HisIE [Clostridiisalibacter paucivorans]